MPIKQLFATNNNCYKAGGKLKPKGIMVHSTGANNPNLSRYVQPDDGLLGKNQYNNHWNQPLPGGRKVCVHAFIGKLKDGSIATYQILPWTMRGWHGGSGSKGSVNDTHIGFEICEDGLTDAKYFNAVYKEAVDLCVYLCKEFSLTEKDIIGHYEGHQLGIASNHADPRHWFSKHGKSMESLREDVRIGLLPPKKEESKGAIYRVQTGAFKDKSNADRLSVELKKKGFDTYIIQIDDLYKVQTGAYSVKSNAEAMVQKLKKAGYDAFITIKSGKPASTTPTPAEPSKSATSKPTPAPTTSTNAIKLGSRVKVKNGANAYDGKGVASFVYNNTYTVDQLKGDRAVLDSKGLCTAFNVKDLVLASGSSASSQKQGRVTAHLLNVRQSGSASAKIVGLLKKNDKFTIYEEKNGWYRIGSNRWVNKKYTKLI